MAKEINWNQVIEWDKKYHVKVFTTEEQYHCVPIDHTEGDHLVTPDGTRLLDCMNQLCCVNAGQSHPKIQAAIREATERYGFVWEVFTTDYSARACKLVIEDLLGPYGWAGKVSWVPREARLLIEHCRSPDSIQDALSLSAGPMLIMVGPVVPASAPELGAIGRVLLPQIRPNLSFM